MSNLNTTHHFDVIIVGSGGAGLSLALSLPQHFNIAVLAKSNLTDASTFYAQGGVAAVLDETDSIEQHIDDTMIAGAHLCETEAVKQTVEGGKPSVDFLLKHGVQFTLDDQEQLHLTREGGHSQRRIIHAADATGRAISTTLVERAIEKDNITIFENYIAIDLITSQKLGLEEQNRALIDAYSYKDYRMVPPRDRTITVPIRIKHLIRDNFVATPRTYEYTWTRKLWYYVRKLSNDKI